MTAAWVASGVRARAMSRRRLGRVAIDSLSRLPDVDSAVDALVSTPYGHDVTLGLSLAEAQHAVSATTLWHIRVLAGWVPRGDAQFLRVLAGGFEIANVDEALRGLLGRTTEPAYRLGSLATAWHALRSASTVAEIRDGLSRSAWGDPGSDSPETIRLTMRLTWAERVAATIPQSRDWAAGAAALIVAREVVVGGRHLDPLQTRITEGVLGIRWTASTSLEEYQSLLPPHARWAVAGVTEPRELWRAEQRWWNRLETDGMTLLHKPLTGPEPTIGSVAVLASDAWRVRAALELAARGGLRADVSGVGDAVA
jgi:hypothetical protein